MDDANVMFGDGGVDIVLGEKQYRIKPLVIGKSIEWSKRVQAERIKAAMKQLQFVQSAKSVQNEKDVDDLVEKGTTVSIDLEALIGFIEAHSPSLKKPLQNATVNQVIAAFEAIKELENPTDKLIKAFR